MELVGSGESVHEVGSGNTARRVFLVPWSQRLLVAENLLGSPHPSVPYCWCRRVAIYPAHDEAKAWEENGEIQYGLARLEAEYATDFSLAPWPIPKPAVRPGTSLAIQSIRIGGEFMRVPGRAVAWEDNPQQDPSGPVPEDNSPAGRILVRTAEISLVWQYVDEPPIGTWNSLLGAVNGTWFLGCPPETLLFVGYELAPDTKASITSPSTWRLLAAFSYRGINVGSAVYGWNHELRADGWHRVVMDDGAGNKVLRYRLASFNAMFL